jgi:hypothetical protein
MVKNDKKWSKMVKNTPGGEGSKNRLFLSIANSLEIGFNHGGDPCGSQKTPKPADQKLRQFP